MKLIFEIEIERNFLRCFLQYDRLYVENEIYLYNEIEQRVERMIIGKKEVEVGSVHWISIYSALKPFSADEWNPTRTNKQAKAKNWESPGTEFSSFVQFISRYYDFVLLT